MCGIAGRIEFGANLRTGQSEAGRMNNTILHRGPDDGGVLASNHAALGNRRLSVIDLPNGHQPMEVATPGGPVAITYNGEVYNAPELRRELKARGHTFRTGTDTEVVLNGYMQWGEGVAEKLRGMFAFAIWDEREQKAVLGRDPVGVKPLHYYQTPGGVLFGSEPKAILSHPLAKSEVGLSGWREMFAHVKSPGAVIWEGMQEVKPGSVVTVYENGIRERPYWRLRSHPHEDSYDETVATVRDNLDRTVQEQLVADVPVGVLLSGGLDSSAITALAARNRSASDGAITSYAVDFTDHDRHLGGTYVPQEDRDAPFADEVAAMWHTNHTLIEQDPTQLASPELRKRIVWARDMPLGLGDHDISRLLLYQKIREHSTVALSGEMADETFGGYVIFTDPKVLQGRGWPWELHNPKDLSDRLSMLNPEFRRSLDMETYLADTYSTAINEVGRVTGESPHERRLREISYLSITRNAGYQLDFTDRLSMASGLEVRVPYTDHKLLEYGYNIPGNMKMSRGSVKGILKDAVSDLVPQSVLERKKSPYPHTPDPTFLRELQNQAQVLVTQPEHRAFNVMSHDWLREAASKPVNQLTRSERFGLNFALELAVWMDLYQPTITTS